MLKIPSPKNKVVTKLKKIRGEEKPTQNPATKEVDTLAIEDYKEITENGFLHT